MKRCLLCLAALSIIAVAGCGYSAQPLLRSDIETVYVPVFDNSTFRRGLEVELTQALIEEINMRTHLRVVSEEQADSVLTGSIADFKETVLTKRPYDPEMGAEPIIEKQLTVYAKFKWVDRRTGRTIARRNDVRVTADVITSSGETLDLARRNAFRRLSSRIVELMEAPW